MKPYLKVCLAVIVIGVIIAGVIVSRQVWKTSLSGGGDMSPEVGMNTHQSPMHHLNLTLTSPAFKNNTPMPDIYTCTGKNINPPLIISGVPEEAVSLALILEDPDAPNGMWNHWVKWNMPPHIIELKEGKEPDGEMGKGTAGNLTYYGPCPPSGTHRYFFKVFAVDTMLTLPPGSSKEDLIAALNGHILAEAELIGLYSKP